MTAEVDDEAGTDEEVDVVWFSIPVKTGFGYDIPK